jgi:hypothetical protein
MELGIPENLGKSMREAVQGEWHPWDRLLVQGNYAAWDICEEEDEVWGLYQQGDCLPPIGYKDGEAL